MGNEKATKEEQIAFTGEVASVMNLGRALAPLISSTVWTMTRDQSGVGYATNWMNLVLVLMILMANCWSLCFLSEKYGKYEDDTPAQREHKQKGGELVKAISRNLY